MRQSMEYALTAAAPLGGVAKVTGSENVDDPQINTGPGSDFDVTVVPRAPAALGSPSKTTTSVDLDWTLSPDDSDLTNYQLERATSSGGPWNLSRTQRRARQPSRTRGFRPARSTAIASRPASRPAVESERWSAASRVRSALRPTRRIRHRVFRFRSLERRVVRGRIRSRSRLLGRRWAGWQLLVPGHTQRAHGTPCGVRSRFPDRDVLVHGRRWPVRNCLRDVHDRRHDQPGDQLRQQDPRGQRERLE